MLSLQANIEAVKRAIAGHAANEMLSLQVLWLRWCLDELSAVFVAENATKDLLDKLQAKQKLRGRDRHVQLLPLD